MILRTLIVALAILPPLSTAAYHQQQPLLPDDVLEFKWPVKKVAIIGAGVSGLIAYREFKRAGFEQVRVFERDEMPGGNWHYTEETPLDAPIPNADPLVGDFVPSLPPPGVPLPFVREFENGDAVCREHRGPKPVWESLESNTPAPIQQITEIPWPEGTPWHVPQRTIARYLRAFASFHGVNSNDANADIEYNTRVELVEKRHDATGTEHGWTLTLKRVNRLGSHSKATWWTENFDAIVVATGRYNAPSMPRIDGLEDWAKKFPGTMMHSRQYRRPQPLMNQTVLIIGGATSGVEISRDVNAFAGKVYQSVRPPSSKFPPDADRLQVYRLPSNVSIVPEIRRFHASNSSIELMNGTFLLDVDRIIFSTGFRYSFPFLPQFHNSSASPSRRPIVTDGSHLRSLHQDFLSIEEPTIGFLSMNWGNLQSFTYSEYLSLALAKLWSGKAILPGQVTLWRLYDERVQDQGGYGRYLQFLGTKRAAANIQYFVGWLNDAAVKFGGRQIDGPSRDLGEIRKVWTLARYGETISQAEDEDFVDALDWVHGEDW